MNLGDDIPVIVGTDQDGSEVSFTNFGKEGYLLAFFYPKAETPGCIKQACSLRDAYSELSDKGVSILGVSLDDVAAQKRFHENRSLPYTLIADTDGKVIEAFDVAKKPTGRAMRQAFLFENGRLIWKDEAASTEEQARDVLAVIG